MTITVIGHLCLDNIHLPSEQAPRKSYGGIAFTLAAFAALLGERDTLKPVFGVGEQEFKPFVDWLGQFPRISTDGIYSFPGPTNEVHLFYSDKSEGRVECSKHIAPPIPFDRIKPFLNADGILINMISGSDISLETLDRIRMDVRDKGTPIHFDFHSLTLGIDREFKRFRRPLPDWRRWCFMLRSVQMSELEASGLTTEKYDEEHLMNQLMPLMVNELIITRSERGATLVRQEHKKLFRHEEPGIVLKDSIDPTGCGDVFGAAYVYRVLQSNDPIDAVRFANQVAAHNTRFSGPEGLRDLRASLKEMQLA